MREQHTAVVADAQHPAADAQLDVVGGVDGRRHGVAGCLADRIGLHAIGLQPLQLRHPDPHLLGQPRWLVVGAIGA